MLDCACTSSTNPDLAPTGAGAAQVAADVLAVGSSTIEICNTKYLPFRRNQQPRLLLGRRINQGSKCSNDRSSLAEWRLMVLQRIHLTKHHVFNHLCSHRSVRPLRLLFLHS